MNAAFNANTEGIAIYLLQSFVHAYEPLGATIVPLRACRPIETETGRAVGWYIDKTKVAILHSGLLVGVCFVLPDSQPLFIHCEDLGVASGQVQIGQLLELEHIRLVHPVLRKIVVS